jgi:hypothetical protein
MIKPTNRRIATKTAAALLAASLGGCGANSPIHLPGSSENTLKIDPADPCHSQRADFADSQSYFTDQILKSSLIGAVSGAALGTVTAAASGGKLSSGALWGGLIGLFGGAAVGYAQAMDQKYQDQTDLAKGINADLKTETGQIDHVTATFARLRQCRFNQAWLIKTEMRNHQITRADALAQLDQERQRFAEETALAQKYGIAMTKRDDQFREAVQTVKPSTAGASQAQLAATSTLPEKRNSFDKSVASAESSADLAFNLDNPKKVSGLARGSTNG